MTGAMRDRGPAPESQWQPPLAVYEPSHGPMWVATLPKLAK